MVARPDADLIDELVQECVAEMQGVPSVIKALQEAPMDNKNAMAVALGKLTKLPSFSVKHVMDLVNYILTKADLAWTAVQFELIREAVENNQLDVANDWIKNALANASQGQM